MSNVGLSRASAHLARAVLHGERRNYQLHGKNIKGHLNRLCVMLNWTALRRSKAPAYLHLKTLKFRVNRAAGSKGRLLFSKAPRRCCLQYHTKCIFRDNFGIKMEDSSNPQFGRQFCRRRCSQQMRARAVVTWWPTTATQIVSKTDGAHQPHTRLPRSARNSANRLLAAESAVQRRDGVEGHGGRFELYDNFTAARPWPQRVCLVSRARRRCGVQISQNLDERQSTRNQHQLSSPRLTLGHFFH